MEQQVHSQVHAHMRNVYNLYLAYNTEVSLLKQIDVRRVRQANFPECVSEYVVYRVLHHADDQVCREVTVGDLTLANAKLEVKCTQRGPISFGPTEAWEKLYILQVKRVNADYAFDLYCIDLPNTSAEWKAVKVSRRQTFEDQAKQGRRPRIQLSQLLVQVPYTIVYSGFVRNLLE